MIAYKVSRGLPNSLLPLSGLLSPKNQVGDSVGGQSDFRLRGLIVCGGGRVILKETFRLPRGYCRRRRGCDYHFLSGVGVGNLGTIVLVGRRRWCGPKP